MDGGCSRPPPTPAHLILGPDVAPSLFGAFGGPPSPQLQEGGPGGGRGGAGCTRLQAEWGAAGGSPPSPGVNKGVLVQRWLLSLSPPFPPHPRAVGVWSCPPQPLSFPAVSPSSWPGLLMLNNKHFDLILQLPGVGGPQAGGGSREGLGLHQHPVSGHCTPKPPCHPTQDPRLSPQQLPAREGVPSPVLGHCARGHLGDRAGPGSLPSSGETEAGAGLGGLVSPPRPRAWFIPWRPRGYL